jgi:hypothetical protein
MKSIEIDRKKSLIEELVNEREAIVQNAEKVRQAMAGAHQGVSADLKRTSEEIEAAAEGAAQRLSESLKERGDQIAISLSETGDRAAKHLAARPAGQFDRFGQQAAGLAPICQ